MKIPTPLSPFQLFSQNVTRLSKMEVALETDQQAVMDPRLEIYAPNENELLLINFPRRATFAQLSALRKNAQGSGDDEGSDNPEDDNDLGEGSSKQGEEEDLDDKASEGIRTPQDDDNDEDEEEDESGGKAMVQGDDDEGGERGGKDKDKDKENDDEGGEGGSKTREDEDDDVRASQTEDPPSSSFIIPPLSSVPEPMDIEMSDPLSLANTMERVNINAKSNPAKRSRSQTTTSPGMCMCFSFLLFKLSNPKYVHIYRFKEASSACEDCRGWV